MISGMWLTLTVQWPSSSMDRVESPKGLELIKSVTDRCRPSEAAARVTIRCSPWSRKTESSSGRRSSSARRPCSLGSKPKTVLSAADSKLARSFSPCS